LPGVISEIDHVTPTFLYRCPNTGRNVQGYVADEVSEDTYESVTCLACRQVHLVNAKTGKVLGDDKVLD